MHGDAFTTPFNIRVRGADNSVTVWGVGIERWVLAFIMQYGLNSFKWTNFAKADIGAALLHEPEILFLDEPTIGLDVVAKENIRKFLNRVNRETNITMLYTNIIYFLS